MRIDGKWYDRFGSSQVRYLPQQGFTPGWLTVEAVLRDFGLEWDDLTVWFPIFGKLRKAKIRTLSGGSGVFWSVSLFCAAGAFSQCSTNLFHKSRHCML